MKSTIFSGPESAWQRFLEGQDVANFELEAEALRGRPESQDWSHLLNQNMETQPASEDLLQTQVYQPPEDLLQTQVYHPSDILLQAKVYEPMEREKVSEVLRGLEVDPLVFDEVMMGFTERLQAWPGRKKAAAMTAVMPPSDTTLSGLPKKAADDHLKATSSKQSKNPLETTLETTQCKPKWKKLRRTGDTGGTADVVE